jgi:hypothetical protein
MKKIIIMFIISTLCFSCVTKYHPNIELKNSQSSYTIKTVYVENPELIFEYNVLKESELYKISPNPETPNHLRLKPAEQYSSLVELDMLLPVVSLGIIPVRRNTGYRYKYLLINGNETTEMELHLSGYYQTSLWEMFRKNYVEDEKTYGKMLKAQVTEQENKNK